MEEEDSKETHKNWRARLRQIQGVLVIVQNVLGYLADLGERIKKWVWPNLLFYDVTTVAKLKVYPASWSCAQPHVRKVGLAPCIFKVGLALNMQGTHLSNVGLSTRLPASLLLPGIAMVTPCAVCFNGVSRSCVGWRSVSCWGLARSCTTSHSDTSSYCGVSAVSRGGTDMRLQTP